VFVFCEVVPLERTHAGVGRRYTARRAMQQAHPETLFQLPHRMARRSWRDVELCRRGPKASLIGDRDECGQVGQSPRSIPEFLSVPNAMDIGFTFSRLHQHLGRNAAPPNEKKKL
jgi:hypothetical protein